MKLKRDKKCLRRNRRHRNSTILSQEQRNIPTPDEPNESSGIFNLETMVKLCNKNWSLWLSQVSVARIQQVTTLADKPSIENIELLQDLEMLGVKIGQVRWSEIAKT